MSLVGAATSASIGWLKRAAAGLAPSTLLNGLVSYWALDEQSGTRADAVGSNDLTDNNTVLAVNRGPVGTVGSFVPANSENLTIAALPVDVSTTSMSWAMWIYPTLNDIQSVFGCGGNGNSGWNPSMAINPAWQGGEVQFQVSNRIGESSLAVGTGVTGLLNNWSLVVGTWDLATKVAAVKVFAGGGIFSFTGSALGTAPVTPIPTTFSLGGVVGTSPSYYAGRKSEAGVWSRVLTAGEMTSLFAAGNGKRYADLTAAEKVGLVSYWDLSEVSGQRNDSHGSNHLTDNNTVGSVNTGPLGTVAGTFVEANNESLTKVSADVSWMAGDFTISYWLKVTDPATANLNTVFSVYPAYPDLRLRIQATPQGDGNCLHSIAIGDGAGNTGAAGSYRIGEDSGWHHYVATRVLSTDTLTLYRDTGTDWGNSTPIAVVNYDPPTTAAIVSIGSGNNNTEFSNAIQVAGVGVWGRVLSTEITSLFNSCLGKRYSDLTTAEKVGLVSYWNLDETSGDRADSHGSNTLSDNNTVLSVVNAPPAMNGAAANFVYSNSEDFSRAALTLPDYLTLSLWVVRDSGSTITIFSQGGWGGSSRLVSICNPTSAQLMMGDGGVTYVSATGSTIPTGEWHHLLYTVDTDNKGRIYQNNVLTATTDALPNVYRDNSAAFRIGGGQALGGDQGGYWDGLIDEVGLWSRVLTEDERAELFALGRGKYYDFSS